MPYNPVQETRPYSNEEMGLPDFAEAIKQGMMASQRAAETAYTPKALAEKLLSAHLENKQRQILNQFLPQSESLRLGALGLNNSLLGNNLTESNYRTQLLRSMLGGGEVGSPQENSADYSNPSDMSIPSGNENYTDQYGQVLPSEEAYNEAANAAPETAGNFNEQSSMQRKAGGMSGLDVNELRNNPMKRAAIKQLLGYDVAAETPEEKQARDLGTVEAREQIKLQAKDKAEEQKEMRAAQKDLPVLQKSLEDVREMKRIAHNKPHLFGKAFPEWSARYAKDPDVGRFQNKALGVIGNAEGKLSARGNVLALKIASQFKPTLSENAVIAEGKLDSMEQELLKAIQNSKANKTTNSDHDPLGLLGE